MNDVNKTLQINLSIKVKFWRPIRMIAPTSYHVTNRLRNISVPEQSVAVTFFILLQDIPGSYLGWCISYVD
jgi:hypothetical protein